MAAASWIPFAKQCLSVLSGSFAVSTIRNASAAVMGAFIIPPARGSALKGRGESRCGNRPCQAADPIPPAPRWGTLNGAARPWNKSFNRGTGMLDHLAGDEWRAECAFDAGGAADI